MGCTGSQSQDQHIVQKATPATDEQKNQQKAVDTKKQKVEEHKNGDQKHGESEKHKVIFVCGGPGAGKGTQCEKMIAKFGVTHLSTGDLLRAERANKSADAELIEGYLKEGKLVPSEILVKLVHKAMDAKPGHIFLLDGFPRGKENLEVWKKMMTGKTQDLFMLFFDCSEAAMEKRLLHRGETSGRSDDNPETIKKRFHTFQEETKPILDIFEQEGKMARVNADGEIDQIFEQVCQVFAAKGIHEIKK